MTKASAGTPGIIFLIATPQYVFSASLSVHDMRIFHFYGHLHAAYSALMMMRAFSNKLPKRWVYYWLLRYLLADFYWYTHYFPFRLARTASGGRWDARYFRQKPSWWKMLPRSACMIFSAAPPPAARSAALPTGMPHSWAMRADAERRERYYIFAKVLEQLHKKSWDRGWCDATMLASFFQAETASPKRYITLVRQALLSHSAADKRWFAVANMQEVRAGSCLSLPPFSVSGTTAMIDTAMLRGVWFSHSFPL